MPGYSYAHDNHYQWVEQCTKTTCSPLGKEVANVLGFVGNGLYNSPIKVAKTDWTNDHDISVIWSGSFANWDNFELSALLIECHRRLLRDEIEPHNFRSLKLSFWQRKSREGGISERLPELSTIQNMIDEARSSNVE